MFCGCVAAARTRAEPGGAVDSVLDKAGCCVMGKLDTVMTPAVVSGFEAGMRQELLECLVLPC